MRLLGIFDPHFKYFEIDSRALEAARVLTGIFLLFDGLMRLTSSEYLQLSPLLVGNGDAIGQWFIHGNGYSIDLLLYGLQSLAGVAVMLGVWSMVATVVSLMIAISLQNFLSPTVNPGQHRVIQLLYFGLLLGWGSSLALLPHQKWRETWRGKWSVFILLQTAMLYTFSVLSKTGASWFDGTAAGLAVSNPIHYTWFSHVLLFNPIISVLTTWYVYLLEALAPLLLFSPWRPGVVRSVAVFLLIGMHIGFSFFLNIGLFSIVMVAGLLLFLPKSFWDSVLPLPETSNDAQPERAPHSRLIALTVAAAIVLSVLMNLASLAPYHQYARMPGSMREVLEMGRNISGYREHWTVFAPEPGREMRLLHLDLYSTSGAVLYERPFNNGLPVHDYALHPLFRYIVKPEYGATSAAMADHLYSLCGKSQLIGSYEVKIDVLRFPFEMPNSIMEGEKVRRECGK